jgi:arginine/lysine/histidine transport system permease protein
MHNFAEIWPSLPYIMGGVIVTLKYTILSVFFGMILGTFLSLAKMSNFPVVSWLASVYTSIFRGTPLLVQLILVYHATPELTGYKISAFEAGILAFSLNSAAYVSEIIRAGIQAVDRGQLEAALSLGIPYSSAMKDIILPQAIKNILPALVNEVVNLLKESSLISVLGEADILRRANIVASDKFIYFEPLIAAGVLYYVLVMVLSGFANLLEKRLQRSD